MNKKLTKSEDKVICGVCGGIAEYVDIDPTTIRLLTAIIAFCTGVLTIAFIYFIAALIIPSK